MKTLTIATTNPGKIHEVRLALHDLPGWKIDPLPAGIPGIDESGTTFIENATLKATHYSRFVEGLALADVVQRDPALDHVGVGVDPIVQGHL